MKTAIYYRRKWVIIGAVILTILVGIITFLGASAYIIRNAEVYWEHNSYTMSIFGYEWEYDSFCNCSDCTEKI